MDSDIKPFSLHLGFQPAAPGADVRFRCGVDAEIWRAGQACGADVYDQARLIRCEVREESVGEEGREALACAA